MVSLGNYGNTIDGQVVREVLEGDVEVSEERFVHSLTSPYKALSSDRQYYYVPYEDTKPCLHIKFNWQDHRRRVYLSNMVHKVLENLVCLYCLCIWIACMTEPMFKKCPLTCPYFRC